MWMAFCATRAEVEAGAARFQQSAKVPAIDSMDGTLAVRRPVRLAGQGFAEYLADDLHAARDALWIGPAE